MRKDMMDYEYKLLKQAYLELDWANGEYGQVDRLCLFCFSKEYSAKGIVHTDDCIIRQIRNYLAKNEKQQRT